MTLCPIALLAGCKKCPAFSVCPLKGLIGDYRKEEETQTAQKVDKEKKAEGRGRGKIVASTAVSIGSEGPTALQ